MKASKNNGFGRKNGWLSDIVKSEMPDVETPNRTVKDGDEWAQTGYSGQERFYGARSGTGKTLTTK